MGLGKQVFGLLFLISAVRTLMIDKTIDIASPPSFTKEPKAGVAYIQIAEVPYHREKKFVLFCEAEGDQIIRYRWLKNGQKFNWREYSERMTKQPRRGTIIIQSPREEDEGYYQCFAENKLGVAASNIVQVKRSEMAKFKDDKLQTVTTQEGHPLKLECEFTPGIPEPHVYWVKENIGLRLDSISSQRITGDPFGNLWFSNVTREDASQNFYYVCALTSVLRNEYKLGNRVMLDVIPRDEGTEDDEVFYGIEPQFISEQNVVAYRGKKTELYCIFSGTPIPSVSWKKNDLPIAWSERINTANYGKSLVLHPVGDEDAGDYTCEAGNGIHDNQTFRITVTVMAEPYFIKEPESQMIAENDTVEINCGVGGIPKPTVRWFHNGLPIEDAARNLRRTVSDERIVIRRVTKEDTGNYACNASNTFGYVFKDVYVNVLAISPKVIKPPGDVTVNYGNSIIIPCQIFGIPKPEIRWMKSNLELSGGRFDVLDNGDLEISNVYFSDSGKYHCYAKNKFGTAEANGSIVVDEHTKINIALKHYEIIVGQQIKLLCYSNVSTSIRWIHNGEVIDFENNGRLQLNEDNSMTILRSHKEDSGSYSCVPRANLAFVRANATLLVLDVPDAPEIISIKCQPNIASIRWQAAGTNGSPIRLYAAEYSTNLIPNIWRTSYWGLPGNQMSTTIRMKPWLTYTFRIKAINDIGESLPSLPSDPCKSEPAIPQKNPRDVRGEGTAPNTMLVSWQKMEEPDHNAPNFHYRVYWRRDLLGMKWEQQDIFDWTQTEMEIKELPVFQRYKIKVSAVNSVGECAVPPEEVIGYQGEDYPTLAPSNFILTEVKNSNSAVIKWDAVPSISVRGILRGYRVITWTDETTRDNATETIVEGNATNAMISTLVPFRLNYAQVSVFNGHYNGPQSVTIAFTMPEGLAGKIEYFDSCHLGHNAFLLYWERPDDKFGNIIGYRIYYNEIVNGTVMEPRQPRVPQIFDSDATTAKLTGLNSNTRYRLSIAAVTRAGEAETTFIDRTTFHGASAIPEVAEFEWKQLPNENGLGSVRVQWKPFCNVTAGASFFVQYRLKGQNEWSRTEYEEHDDWVLVRSLYLNTVYEFRVVSVDGPFMTESEYKDVNIQASFGRTQEEITADYSENSQFQFYNSATTSKVTTFLVFLANIGMVLSFFG